MGHWRKSKEISFPGQVPQEVVSEVLIRHKIFIRAYSWDQPVEGFGGEGSKTGQKTTSCDTVPTNASDN